MTAYYNEIDPYAAQWLRNLIAAGHIAPGIVDERSIEDVRPDELAGYRQCHFFAGIGVWSYALRLAGWPDDREIWTGSCPCQPFSAAGAGGGFDDERHLWPAFFHLIRERRPAIVVGEQVASKDADPWIDLVCSDLGSLGYASGAIAFPAASVGSPNIRDRLYWVAHASRGGLGEFGRALVAWNLRHADGSSDAPGRMGNPNGEHTGWNAGAGGGAQAERELRSGADCVGAPSAVARRVAHADGGNTSAEGIQRSGQHRQQQEDSGTGGLADSHEGQRRRLADGEGRECDRAAARWEQGDGEPATSSELRGLADSAGDGQWQRQHAGDVVCEAGAQPEHEPRIVSDGAVGRRADGYAGPVNGFWRGADWLLCRDGRWRPVEPGTFPLAHGAAARVGRLRAYGNAINAEAARVFIESVMEL